MGESLCGVLSSSSPKKLRSIRIQSAENGYTIHSDYSGRGTLIANTLGEALELVRKELE